MSDPRYALLIVGERCSRLAIARDASWERGGQCATPRRAAFAACGIDPARVAFRNLFEELGQDAHSGAPEPPLVVGQAALAAVRAAQAQRRAIVALPPPPGRARPGPPPRDLSRHRGGGDRRHDRGRTQPPTGEARRTRRDRDDPRRPCRATPGWR